MADARAKAVINVLADLYSRSRYMFNLMFSLREPLGRGDSIEVPSQSSVTVNSDGQTGASPESLTVSVLTLSANLHPFINVVLPAVDSLQLLDGNWPTQTARQAITEMMNHVDTALSEYLITVAYDTSGTYHDNEASAALSGADILNCKAALLDQGGINMQDIALFVGPYGEASLMNISGFIPNFQLAEQGQLGIPFLGSVYGIPVYMTTSVQRRRTVTSTAFANVSNVQTITVAAGHGLVPGVPVTFDTVTAGGDVATATAVVSVTATTVVIANAGADASGTEAGTITIESTENIMCDRTHVYVAMQKLPTLRVVPDYDSTDDALQVSVVWGRIARAGRVRILHSPPTSA